MMIHLNQVVTLDGRLALIKEVTETTFKVDVVNISSNNISKGIIVDRKSPALKIITEAKKYTRDQQVLMFGFYFTSGEISINHSNMIKDNIWEIEGDVICLRSSNKFTILSLNYKN